MERNWKLVFHVHTDYSEDGNLSADRLAELAWRQSVNCLAVTDHDTIAGALAVREAARGDFEVIIGEEVSTREGHLIGLFLHESIEPGLPARRTAENIHRQGGVVIAPHPFTRILNCSLGGHVYDLLNLLDAVEICNAQNFLQRPNRRAAEFARVHNLPSIAGADVHLGSRIDACYQWIRPFKGAAEFRTALKDGRLVTGRHSLAYFAQCGYVEVRKRLGLGFPADYGRNFAPRPAGLPSRLEGRASLPAAE